MRKEIRLPDDNNLIRLAMHYDIGHISMNLYLFASVIIWKVIKNNENHINFYFLYFINLFY